jgi:3-oxoacyl-[acyl-carrier-protein] synthase II
MTAEPIVFTGIGVVTPLGTGKEKFWKGLIEGSNAIREITAFDTSRHRTHRGGEALDFDFASSCPDLARDRMGRGSQFAVVASREALNDGGLDAAAIEPTRIGLTLGTAMGESPLTEQITDRMIEGQYAALSEDLVSNAVPDSMAGNAARALGLRGPVSLLYNACAGGNYAIGHAADLLTVGAVDYILAGGTDPRSRIGFTGFNSMLAVAPEKCQPFDRNRRGMCPAEGCAVFLLERLSTARRRGARIYAVLAGFGASNDAYHMTSPHPQARGAVRALRLALAQAHVDGGEIDYISAHGTGTLMNDKTETLAMKQVLGDAAYRIPMSSIKSMIGHTMGASSAIEAAACLLAMERSVIPPTINYETPDPECDLDYVPNAARDKRVDIAVSNAYALGGHCSSIVLRKEA